MGCPYFSGSVEGVLKPREHQEGEHKGVVLLRPRCPSVVKEIKKVKDRKR